MQTSALPSATLWQSAGTQPCPQFGNIHSGHASRPAQHQPRRGGVAPAPSRQQQQQARPANTRHVKTPQHRCITTSDTFSCYLPLPSCAHAPQSADHMNGLPCLHHTPPHRLQALVTRPTTPTATPPVIPEEPSSDDRSHTCDYVVVGSGIGGACACCGRTGEDVGAAVSLHSTPMQSILNESLITKVMVRSSRC